MEARRGKGKGGEGEVVKGVEVGKGGEGGEEEVVQGVEEKRRERGYAP